MALCDVTFCELKIKDVINICDGRRLGRIIDMVIDMKTGRVRGLLLPGSRTFNIFKQPEDLFIPWRNILRIGQDVILIEILPQGRKKNIHEEGKKEECACAEEESAYDKVYDESLAPKLSSYFEENE